MSRKRKKPESVSKWFKPVSKTSKNDSNENDNPISENQKLLEQANEAKSRELETSRKVEKTQTELENETVEHIIAIGDGIDIIHGINVTPAVTDTNVENNIENQVEEIVTQLDNLDIKSKLVKEFKEKLAAHGLMLNSSIDLVSSELDPGIESAILAISCPDITVDIPTNVHFHKFFLIFLYL